MRPFSTPIDMMKRTLTASVICASLIVIALGYGACSDSPDVESIPLSVESQDNIVSEDGTLELTSGTLAIKSVSLIGEAENVPLTGPISVNLAVPNQELQLRSHIPPGDYTGLHIELAPAAEGARMLDVQIRSTTTTESTRAISKLAMSDNKDFPEGPRAIAEGSRVELHLLLRGMFFYLAPLSDSVDGVYEAGENERDFLTMDLIGMFDLRVLP